MAKSPWEMTDAELAAYIEEMQGALAQRQSLEAVRVQMGDAIKDARSGGVLEAPEDGAEWSEPEDIVEVYAKGDRVTRDGRLWVLERGACTGPPSVENGWAEAPAAEEENDDE